MGDQLGDDKKQGFGFEEDKAQEDKPKKAQGKKFGESGMEFTRPKKFISRKAGQFGGNDFSEGLDTLEEDGSSKKKDIRPKGDGHREFVNLGSQAKTGQEEEQKTTKKEAVKPTFRGKLNLTKTGGNIDEKNEGVVKDYSFQNVYKTPFIEGERRERREGDDDAIRGGRGGRKAGGRDRGEAIGA